jgi:hypothetical protein
MWYAKRALKILSDPISPMSDLLPQAQDKMGEKNA